MPFRPGTRGTVRLRFGGSQWCIAGPTIERQAIYDATENKTFIVFQGKYFATYATYWDHEHQFFAAPVLVFTSPLTNDSHGTPCLEIDASGFLHVFGACHHSPIKYSRSTNARDINQWTSRTAPESDATYPNIFRKSDEDLWLLYRGENTGEGGGGHIADYEYRISTDDGATWGSPVAFIDSVGPDYAFYCGFALHSDDKLGVGVIWKDDTNSLSQGGPEFIHRYNIYYFEIHDDGTATTVDGTSLTLPLTKATLDSDCLVVNSSTDHTNTPGVTFDASGNPHMVFVRGPLGTSHTYYHTRWNGTSWVTTSTGLTTDHLFDGNHIYLSGSDIDIYAISEGTEGATGDNDSDLVDRGGHLYRVSSSDSGATWGTPVVIHDASIVNYPIIPKDFQSDLKVLVADWPRTLADFDANIYGYGA